MKTRRGKRNAGDLKRKPFADNANGHSLNKSVSDLLETTNKSSRNADTLSSLEQLILHNPKLLIDTQVRLSPSAVDSFLQNKKWGNVSPAKAYPLRKRNLVKKYVDSSLDESALVPARSPKKADVYEFDYDPDDEPSIIKKRKQKRLEVDEYSDDSMRHLVEHFNKQQKRKKRVRIAKKVAVKEIVLKLPDNEVEVAHNTAAESVTVPSLPTNDIDVIVQSFIDDDDSPLRSPTPAKTSTLNTSYPWRPTIKYKNPRTFTIKTPSYTPNYDQDIIIKSPMINTPNRSLDFTLENQRKPKYQATLLGFLNKPKPAEPDGLFVEKPATPRRVLGSLNIDHSTPIHKAKPRNEIEDLFGFGTASDVFDVSDIENQPPNLRKKSPRKKPTRVNFEDVKLLKALQVKDAANTKQPEKEVPEKEKETVVDVTDLDINNAEVSVGLFQDFEEELQINKNMRRSYERKRPRRVRLPSVDSYHSEEEDIPESPARKKRRNACTKKEEEEAEKLAGLYNSMFKEVESHSLCIE